MVYVCSAHLYTSMEHWGIERGYFNTEVQCLNRSATLTTQVPSVVIELGIIVSITLELQEYIIRVHWTCR